MELLILDTNFETVAIVDTFESIIWTDRYIGFGDFEVYTTMDYEAIQYFQKKYYLWSKESNRVMIIEDREIISDFEDGSRLKITGRSLESILDRRVIWYPTVISGSLQNSIFKLINENVINPSDIRRKISNFVFLPSEDVKITSLTYEAQYFGENLYDSILDICKQANIGFRIILDNANNFVFELYSGEDRSYDQEVNPYVVFSPNFDNLISTNYLDSNKNSKTISLVIGENIDDTDVKKTAIAIYNNVSGLERRETTTDASSIRSKVDDVVLSDSEYTAQLEQKGLEDLATKTNIESFEGHVDTSKMYIYDVDFFMGDIVQISNEYGIETKTRLTEIVRSHSTSGIETVPTFSIVE